MPPPWRPMSVLIRSRIHKSLLSTEKKQHLSSTSHIDTFENYFGHVYPAELGIKYTTESNTSAFYSDVLLSIGRGGQLRISLYDKRDKFNFYITKCPFLSSNVLSSPAYGVFISQFIWYARAFPLMNIILRAARLSCTLLRQGYTR